MHINEKIQQLSFGKRLELGVRVANVLTYPENYSKLCAPYSNGENGQDGLEVERKVYTEMFEK